MAELKHRWSVMHNYLAGITLGDWRRLLRENRPAVDAVYWHRAAFISLLAAVNSRHRRREEAKFAAEVAKTSLAGPPLFVLGHWRSGTTHLHNLLAQDARFAFPNTYQVVNPHTFLTTEETNTRRFAWMLPGKRPMDNMALTFQSPQEDEFAPALMSLRSLYVGVSFPRRIGYYEKFLTFHEAAAADRAAWMDAFRTFLQKLTLKHQRPLVLKSPTHTARVRLLLEMFPDAKFVHIRRDPLTVFQSFRHYYDTAMWHTYLQRLDRSGIDDEIIRRYVVMAEAYAADRALIPSGHLHEVTFDELERDPLGTLAGTYEALALPSFETTRPAMEAYLSSLRGYEKNRFTQLDAATRDRVLSAWGSYER